MSIFQMVKENISPLEAAKYYGLKVGRNRMCICPFHNDKHPSMKVDEKKGGGFYCFGCQESGDVITLVAKINNIGNLEAAQKLAMDFGLNSDIGVLSSEHTNYKRKPQEDAQSEKKRKALLKEVENYLEDLQNTKWNSEERALHVLEQDEAYCYAINQLDRVQDCCLFLRDCSEEEAHEQSDRIRTEVRKNADRFREIRRGCAGTARNSEER